MFPKYAVADQGGGGRGGRGPPGPVKISHKKDGRRRRPHRFHVSWPPLTWLLDLLLIRHHTITGGRAVQQIACKLTKFIQV